MLALSSKSQNYHYTITIIQMYWKPKKVDDVSQSDNSIITRDPEKILWCHDQQPAEVQILTGSGMEQNAHVTK